MKKTSLFTKSQTLTNHDINRMAELDHAKAKQDAYADGKYAGMGEQPAKGARIIHYIGSYKTRYEQTIAKILQAYQPALQLPAGKMESDKATVIKTKLNEEISRQNIERDNLYREMGNRNPAGLASRIWRASAFSVVMFIMDTAFNVQCFETTGHNLLFSVILSGAVSFMICLGAHFAGKHYQTADTRLKKILIIALSAIFIIALGSVMAAFRASLYRITGTDINPNLFTFLNMGFFLIAALVTYHFHPTHIEIQENREDLNRLKKIRKLAKKLDRKEKVLGEYSQASDEKIQGHLQSAVQPEYLIELVKVMYLETVNEFKRAYWQASKEIPDFFNDEIPALDIANITMQGIINKYKNHNNENNTNNSAD